MDINGSKLFRQSLGNCTTQCLECPPTNDGRILSPDFKRTDRRNIPRVVKCTTNFMWITPGIEAVSLW
jgi:hypothetical protein